MLKRFMTHIMLERSGIVKMFYHIIFLYHVAGETDSDRATPGLAGAPLFFFAGYYNNISLNINNLTLTPRAVVDMCQNLFADLHDEPHMAIIHICGTSTKKCRTRYKLWYNYPQLDRRCQMAETNGKTITAPYVPYKTFVATLDSFANFLPDRIDTSIWASYSGGMRSQLLSAYKFLGLIGDDGKPKPELKKLADEKENRGILLRDILKRSYVDLLKLDLSKATPSSFDEELRKYNVEGDTRRKASAFFLTAAKAAGIPLSPLLTARGSMSATRGRSTTARKAKDGTANQGNTVLPPPRPQNPAVPVRAITLENGITLTLTASADTFAMTKPDRTWVLTLLDTLDKYEEDHPRELEDEEDAEDTE